MRASTDEHRLERANGQKRFIRPWKWLLLLLLPVLFPTVVWAQICIPPSLGVPPAYLPPHWWDNMPAQPVYYKTLTDPRWQGAAAVSRSNGTQEINSFLALRDSTHLYLSWRYRGMPLGAAAASNVVYVGYERASDGKPIVVKAELTTLSGAEAEGSGFIDRAAYELPASGILGAPIASPAWVNGSTRTWITPTSFALQMQIPLSELKTTAGGFKLWFEMLAGSPDVALTRFVMPRTGADIVESPPAFDKVFPQPAAWQAYRLSTGPSDASCPAQAVALDQDKIATKNPNPNEILYKESPAAKPENVIYARPTNKSGSNIAAGKLRATFRIANWGSQPDFADWEVGVPIEQLWAKVPCAGGDINGAVGTVGDIANGTTATNANELRCSWTLTDAELTPFKNGTKNSHSCLLVEMSDTVVPGLVYRNRSMWNNFDVRSASVLEKPAQITLKGLKPISPAGRDIYVYVETRNMPDRVAQETPPTDGQGPREGPLALKRAITEGRVGPEELSRMIANGQVSEATLDAVLPTYIVHVFHDTGKQLTTGGVRRPVLNPQSSFGYRVTHAGDLYGWRHQLGVESGFAIDELAPNFYRIRNVPNNGAVNVTTRIEALEHAPTGGKYAVWGGAGIAIPHNSFGNTNENGPAVALGFEYALTNTVSIEATLSGSRLDGKGANADINVTQLGVNGKFYLTSAPLRFFATAGIGSYDFDPGSTRFGGSVGAGLQDQFRPNWGLEGRYTLHRVTNNSPQMTFSTLLLALRYAF